MSDGDVARKTEVLRLEDLICGRVVEDSLGVDASLVRERTVATGRLSVGEACVAVTQRT